MSHLSSPPVLPFSSVFPQAVNVCSGTCARKCCISCCCCIFSIIRHQLLDDKWLREKSLNNRSSNFGDGWDLPMHQLSRIQSSRRDAGSRRHQSDICSCRAHLLIHSLAHSSFHRSFWMNGESPNCNWFVEEHLIEICFLLHQYSLV